MKRLPAPKVPRRKQRGFFSLPGGMGSMGRGSSGGGASSGYLSPFYPTTLYSLRKRRSAYTGACIRVKRSSDSTQTDIGFDSNGWLDEAALAAFVGAGNGFVKKWYDQSGGGVDLDDSGASDSVWIVVSGVIQSLNGRAAIKFVNTPLASQLKAAANAAFAFGTGSWTWETFLDNTANNTTAQSILDFRDASNATGLHYHANANVNTFFQGSNQSSGNADVSFLGATHEAVSYNATGQVVRIFGAGTRKHLVSALSLTFNGNRPLSVGNGYNNASVWQGLMTEIRITKGANQYNVESFVPPNYYEGSTIVPTNTQLLLKCLEANGSTTAADSSNFARTMTRNGNGTVSNAFLGGGNNMLSGGTAASGGWTTPYDSNLQLGAGDFTIRGWMVRRAGSFPSFLYITTATSPHISLHLTCSSAGLLNLRMGFNGSTWKFDRNEASASMGIGVVKFVSITRSGNNVYLHVDGVLRINFTIAAGSIDTTSSNNDLRVTVAQSDATNQCSVGGLEIRKNEALYSDASYTPPTSVAAY